ncbi:ChaN family lipoprotein [Parasulfitobacter algicola]|uniref:ChaN family lipoprotein n=1 Tax=Parasulfitobacter algicola TaxID=2614809 RepID=A0ABX2IZL6_9RHOB|nr:ChaN family lipoprotein [Sulfitobacter algicola]NSX56211.1 ChaN family lipoprotein [Sulfitobacter algicola]
MADTADRVRDDALMQADIIILGEIHDNGFHHKGQAELIERINPKAVVFEMLSSAQAAQINADPRDNLAVLGHRIGWAEAGWPDFALYQPVFEALGETPVVGAAQPRDKVRRAFSETAFGVFGPEGTRFDLDQSLPDEQMALRKDMQFRAHCNAMPMDMMAGMVEAQRYRDASFAAVMLATLDEYGAPIVLIAGNGHARTDWGVPAMIILSEPNIKTLSIGFIERPQPDSIPPFDITIMTDPAIRADPCDAFNN